MEVPQASPPFLSPELRRALGARIRDRRQALRLPQKVLAGRAAVHPARLSRIERGNIRPHLGDLLGLAHTLGCGLDEMVFGAPAVPAGPPAHPDWLPHCRDLTAFCTPEEIAAMSRLLQLIAAGCRARRRDPL